MDTTNIVQPVVDQVTTYANQLLPALATVGALALGITGTVVLWNRFGPALVKKIFSKAS